MPSLTVSMNTMTIPKKKTSTKRIFTRHSPAPVAQPNKTFDADLKVKLQGIEMKWYLFKLRQETTTQEMFNRLNYLENIFKSAIRLIKLCWWGWWSSHLLEMSSSPFSQRLRNDEERKRRTFFFFPFSSSLSSSFFFFILLNVIFSSLAVNSLKTNPCDYFSAQFRCVSIDQMAKTCKYDHHDYCYGHIFLFLAILFVASIQSIIDEQEENVDQEFLSCLVHYHILICKLECDVFSPRLRHVHCPSPSLDIFAFLCFFYIHVTLVDPSSSSNDAGIIHRGITTDGKKKKKRDREEKIWIEKRGKTRCRCLCGSTLTC